MDKSLAFFLVGPTASGKSSIAHLLARKMGHHIISADSMNIYKNMDIGTAKPSVRDRDEVKYFGIDIAEPYQSFSVVEWLEKISYNWHQSNIPIIVGGTGLYIKSLLLGLDKNNPEDIKLRKELEVLSINDLQSKALSELPNLFYNLNNDDRHNPRRLIRLLERKKIGNKWNKNDLPMILGLKIDRKYLNKKITNRVISMYQDGLLSEAEKLLTFDLSKTARQAIGYAEAFDLIAGLYSQDEAIEKTIIRTRQLAKRQMTWFRNQLNVKWINIYESMDEQDVSELVYKKWEEFGASEVLLD